MGSLRLSVWGSALVLGSTAWAQVTQRVSVGANGQQGDHYSTRPLVSADGRYVVFSSHAANFGTGDEPGFDDVFLRDRQLGTTELISVDSNEVPGNWGGNASSISPDARFVVFMSGSTNLVPGDTNGSSDVFVRDRLNGTTERVSYYPNGATTSGPSWGGAISADGRYVTYSYEFSGGGHLLGNQDFKDVYVWDRQTATGEIASVGMGASPTDGDSFRNSISADGRYVAFESLATNLVPGDVNGKSDIFVRDLQTDTTECVSLASGGIPSDGDSDHPSMSADGRYVAFVSGATDLVSGDTNGHTDVFVHDRQSGTTERVSVSSGGTQGDADIAYFWSSQATAISPDGRYVAFESLATNLVAADTNGLCDVFLRDRQLGTTRRISVTSGGIQGSGDSLSPTLSADARYVSFMSYAEDLDPSDTNGVADAFLRDRAGDPSFTSLCVPGFGGVIACPCANPSGGFGQGCDNSSMNGGALLSATGGSYLSSDSLVFVALGERPTALSIVLQGNALIPSGVVYGQGVRCAGGALKRLYTKTASGGIVEAPDFGAGDPSVSAQSAAKGDPISAGQSRWYLVYYRDPVVLGGCPSSSTFNATQTGEVLWSP